MHLLKKIKTLNTISSELQQMVNLSGKLNKLISNENIQEFPKNVSEFKAKKFYNQKIHEELTQISNRKFFLEKEALDLRLSAGKTKTKVNKSIEKSTIYNQLYERDLENKS